MKQKTAREKVILDTDIGSDIDDAVCLAYLLAQPNCDLLGVTTVTGEPVERAKMASALCKIAGKDIPILPGLAKPLLVEQKQKTAPQAAALTRWPHDKKFPQGEAINFLKKTIRDNPGEVTLLTIGPLTNAGLLFAEDPEIPGLLKQMVLMCGVFTHSAGRLEWNAIGDPHASAVVYDAPVKIHKSIGLDVTNRVRMPADEVRAKFKHDLLRCVLDYAEVWFKRATHITFHDPLAATTIFDDKICTFRQGRVQIELTSPRMLGMTHWEQDAKPSPHEVALDVNADSFFKHYFSVF